MREAGQKENKIIYAAIMLLSLVLVSGWLLCNMYARYTTQTEGSDSARVAIFGHGESIQLEKEINNWRPGTTTTYGLSVTNKKGEKVSEVSEKYNIEIVTAGNLPLVYTLTDESGKEIGSYTETAQESSHVFTDTDMLFNAGVEKSQTYQLQVKWQEEKDNYQLSGVPDFIQVNINVEQMD